MIDGRLHAFLRHSPELVRRLFLFCRSCFDIWKGPFEVESKVKVFLISALRYNIANESTAVKVTKIGLGQHEPVKPRLFRKSHVPYLPRFMKVDVLSSLTTRWTHALDNGELVCKGASTGRMINLFERDASSDQGLGFLEHLGIGHWGEKLLRLPAFEQHRFPYLRSIEDRFSTRGIDGKSLRLTQYDHCCDWAC